MTTTLDAALLPAPPIDSVYQVAVGNATAWTFALIGLGLFLYLLRAPGQRIMACAMMVGGALTSLIEPFLDIAGAAWHPVVGQPTVFSLVGRHIPFWVVVCYMVFYGGIGSLNLLAFARGVTRRGVWLWFLVPILADVLMEELMLHWDLYYYYGTQPLIVFREFPLYQAACNSTGELLGITTLLFLRPHLHGWRWFLATAVVLPLGGAMGFLGVGLPSFYAVNTPMPAWAMQLCGLMTWGLTFAVVSAVAQIVGTDSRLRNAAHAPGLMINLRGAIND